MERKLAHIEIIESILPIQGADMIELCYVLGWQCIIAKKDNFKVGDKVIYCEIDSHMPPKPEYEFLAKYNYRIKTQKMRGVVSQGLILPISILSISGDYFTVGSDVTDLLGITKYLSKSEKEENSDEQINIKHWTKKYKAVKWLWRYSWFRNLIKPKQVKWWPEHLSKTDEERIQNIPSVLERFKDNEIYVTEKIDYQSGSWTSRMVPRFKWFLGRILPKKFEFIVCSRNRVTTNKNDLYHKIAEKYNLEQILKENPTLTIQGEQGDAKVQGNKYGITEPTMWVFNIIDHEKNYHYNYTEMQRFCNSYELNIVPIIPNETFLGDNILSSNYCRLKRLGSTVQELVEFSKGKSTLANIQREGVVVRCIENGRKILSFKIINPNFLLKYD